MTKDAADETTPRWSPDGKLLAYYKQDALWIINPDAGEPQQITRVARTNFFFTKAGESFTWSPDSKQIAFVSDPIILPPNPMMERLTRGLSQDELMRLPAETRNTILKAQGKTDAQMVAMEAEYKSQQAKANNYTTDVKVVTRLQYKSRTSFSDNLQSHIFIADIATKQVRQLTSGNYAEHSINWSPKGDEIVFVSNHESDPDKVNNTDLFVANVLTNAVRQLTKTKGCEWQPVFSPDGSQIAYLATTRDVTTIDSVAEDSKAGVISAHDGKAIAFENLDRRVSIIKWMANKNDLAFVVGDKGRSGIHWTNKGKLKILTDEVGSISSLSFGKENIGYVTIVSNEKRPAEMVLMSYPEIKSVTIGIGISNTNKNLTLLSDTSPMREYQFTNEGLEVQGWLVPPINLDETKKYPVILYIHGGPHGMHGYSFNATVQALAAKGYGVLLINPRGSSGYGQKFSDGCVNDWGGGDYRDLMRGVDVALEKFPYLDKDRMGVMGGSYGGYMTNWIVTQTDRFKAAIASASLSNLISFYSTSLYQDLVHAEFNGMPWDNYEKLWDRSPLKHIKNVKTPTMLVHGENDNDVHITQAEEMYTALKMRGVDTVLVRYPREGHGIREPKHKVDNLQRNLDWFEKYLK